MTRSGRTTLLTSEYRDEFDAQTRRMMRRRFLWFSGAMAGLTVLSLLLTAALLLVVLLIQVREPVSGVVRSTAWLGLVFFAYAGCFLVAWKRALTERSMLRTTYALVVIDGVLQVAAPALGIPLIGMAGPMITHMLACGLLPWTPRQAIMPMIPVLAAYVIRVVAIDPWTDGDLPIKIASLALAPLAAMPGVLISWWATGRRRATHELSFFRRRYGEVRRELVDARRLHESLFPPPLHTGPVRFSYRYEPMRQIGGDYLFASRGPGPDDGAPLNLVLMDVTGHGIPAALTVNRLYGELSRIFAEDPGADPGRVLRLLNRYVNLTLANHSLFVTALCARVDPGHDTLEYANAGHPPAFLIGSDLSLQDLMSTATMLGVLEDDSYDPCPAVLRFARGDALVAYTDGVTEAQDASGRQLRIDGLRRLIAGRGRVPVGLWPGVLLGSVAGFRAGPPQDDSLVIEISRPLAPDAAAPHAPPHAHARHL